MVKASVGLGVSLVVFAGDAVAVTVHVMAIAGLAGVERRNARAPRLAAPGEMGALLDLRPRRIIGTRTLEPARQHRDKPARQPHGCRAGQDGFHCHAPIMAAAG